jgi:hypothetical protein
MYVNFKEYCIYLANHKSLSSVQCFKNRTEPAGRTGPTVNRGGGRFGSIVGSGMLSDRSEPFRTGKTGEPAVFENRRFYCLSFFKLKKTKNDVVLAF